jgi:hypothetical protein
VNIRIGRISRLLSPGRGACRRCHTTWRFVKPHHTEYMDWRWCVPLCEKCWSELTPQQRLPYYYDMILEWMKDSDVDTETIVAIQNAVMEGR